MPAPNKYCFILRGLPATGKDIVAKLLANSLAILMDDPNIPVINTDDLFMLEGKYQFDYDRVDDAHKETFKEFKKQIELDRKVIIVNNTNIRRHHYYHYLDYAQKNGYLSSIIILPANDVSDRELANRGSHTTNISVIGKMRRTFEWSI